MNMAEYTWGGLNAEWLNQFIMQKVMGEWNHEAIK